MAGSEPSEIRLTSPSNGAEGIFPTIEFDWDDETAEDMQAYDLQIATDPAFNNVVLERNNIFADEYDLEEPDAFQQEPEAPFHYRSNTGENKLEMGKDYYWRVRGRTHDGATDYESLVSVKEKDDTHDYFLKLENDTFYLSDNS